MGSGLAMNLDVIVSKQLYIYSILIFIIISCTEIVTCDKLRDPRNGDVDLTGITVGSKARYSCNRGFDLKGDQIRKCQSNGQWSGIEPVCKGD